MNEADPTVFVDINGTACVAVPFVIYRSPPFPHIKTIAVTKCIEKNNTADGSSKWLAVRHIIHM